MRAPARVLVLAMALSGVGAAGCQRQRASAADCREIFDRLVQLELAERGYHDPVLLARQTRYLEATLAPVRDACVDRPLPAAAMPCIRRAPNTEAIVHRCLR